MKSKELIKQLQEEDPSGEIEVVCGGDIYFAERLPASCDGRLQVLIRDETKKPFYHVVGMKEVSGGDKILLNILNLEDVCENAYRHPETLIIEGSDEFKEKAKKLMDEILAETFELDYQGFLEHIMGRVREEGICPIFPEEFIFLLIKKLKYFLQNIMMF